jgi:hypothetical protein
MLCWPARSPRSDSSLLPGGTNRSRNSAADASNSSFLLAIRSSALKRRTETSFARASLSRHRKLRIIRKQFTCFPIRTTVMGTALFGRDERADGGFLGGVECHVRSQTPAESP